jgi:methyltransferase (TIGR00027 family)
MMARTDNDSWAITESVGATALGVAASRAAESSREDRLFEDPFAQVFIDAAGEGAWTMAAGGTLPDGLVELDPQMPARMRAMGDYVAARTVFFDEFFMRAARAGLRQAVILAAGLDARAWRLDWPQGATVYELDQPKVLEFKTETLRATGAQPRAVLTNVAIDLRQDWPDALRRAGFDDSVPTAWSAEGLLPYLPAEAQELLFERIQTLSAPGSRIAVEAIGSFDADSLAQQRAMMKKYRAAVLESGTTESAEFTDIADLVYLDERTDIVDWLGAHGWAVEATTSLDLMAQNNRPAAEGLDNAMPQSVFITAER